jgi:hypothetical protein
MVADQGRSQILQANEATKGWSTVLANAGTALAAAGFGAMWISGPDVWAFVWIAFGIAIIAFGIHLLSYLEAEE